MAKHFVSHFRLAFLLRQFVSKCFLFLLIFSNSYHIINVFFQTQVVITNVKAFSSIQDRGFQIVKRGSLGAPRSLSKCTFAVSTRRKTKISEISEMPNIISQNIVPTAYPTPKFEQRDDNELLKTLVTERDESHNKFTRF